MDQLCLEAEMEHCLRQAQAVLEPDKLFAQLETLRRGETRGAGEKSETPMNAAEFQAMLGKT